MNASSLHASNFSQQSQSFANLVMGIRNITSGAKRFLSDGVWYAITLAGVVPLYFLLAAARKKMKQSLSVHVQIDHSNYRQTRLEYDELVDTIGKLGPDQINFQAISWHLKGVMRIVLDVRGLMIQRRDALASAFHALDQQAPTTSLLVPVDQNVLWNRRAQANEYR